MKTSIAKIRQLCEKSGRSCKEGSVQADGSIKIEISPCFFDEAHTSCSAIFFHTDTNDAYYNCFHNSCKAFQGDSKQQGKWLRDAFKKFAPDLLKDAEFTTKKEKTEKAEKDEPLPELDLISARDLDKLNIPPVTWIVKDILTTGVGILAAPSKSFKSFMALQLCIAVCTGGVFLNHKCEKASCLYFDLESTKRRPQSRLRLLLGDREKPTNLFISTSEQEEGKKRRLLGNGFEDQIAAVLDRNPDIKLVIIDVFQKIRRPARRNDSGYDRDYDDMSILKGLQDKYDICILLIHHTRKLPDSDVFNTISGSTGIMGAVDVALMIHKEKRSDEDAILHITGRDVEQQELGIRFDKKSFTWEYKGTADELAEAKRGEEYHFNPVIKTIVALMKTESTWTGTINDLKSASKYVGSHISGTVQSIGQTIAEYEGDLWAWDHIRTERDRNKSSRILTFTKEDT